MGKGGHSRSDEVQKDKARERAHNFSAGPAMLDTAVMKKIQEGLLSYGGSGMGIHETSHRDEGGAVQRLLGETAANLRELLEVPDQYKILFFQGGAHGQFAAVALNLFGGPSTVADFVVGGLWSQKALTECSKYGSIRIAHDAQERGCTSYAPVEEWDLSEDSAFVHICGNETVQGLAFHEDPDVGPDRVLVADMTSSLLSRPIDISKYGVLYASGGKNIGPAGVCIVIVRDDLLDQKVPQTPAILDWRLHSDTDSLHYTPNAFAIWCIHEITNDLLAKGGLERIGVLSHTRAQSLYSVIDQSQGFYTNNVDPKYRSYTAIPFCIKRGNRTLETMFVKGAESKGLRQTFGHATVGGLRVAIYNGLPDESLKEVLDYMCEFAQSYKVHTNSQSIPPGLRGLDKQD